MSAVLLFVALGTSAALALGLWGAGRTTRRPELARSVLRAALAGAWAYGAVLLARALVPGAVQIVAAPPPPAGVQWVAGPAAPAWPTVLLWVWLGGAAVVFARVVHGGARIRRWVGRARPVRDERLMSALHSAATVLGEPAPRMLESVDVSGPTVVGVGRPIVLWPQGWDPDPDRLRAVLLHEVSHCARRDSRWAALAALGTALFWWNPLAWRLQWRLRMAAEFCADRAVIRHGVRPGVYARQLVDAAESYGSPGTAVGFRRGPHEIVARLEALSDDRGGLAASPRRTGPVLFAAACALAGVAAAATPVVRPNVFVLAESGFGTTSAAGLRALPGVGEIFVEHDAPVTETK